MMFSNKVIRFECVLCGNTLFIQKMLKLACNGLFVVWFVSNVIHLCFKFQRWWRSIAQNSHCIRSCELLSVLIKPVLAIDTDLQELRCRSKFKKIGSNPNSSNLNKKNLVNVNSYYFTWLEHVLENTQCCFLLWFGYMVVWWIAWYVYQITGYC